MLVFGDVETTRAAKELRAQLLTRLAQITPLPPGRLRHEALVAALIAAGELVGGLLDNAFHAKGHDDLNATSRDGMAALTELARALEEGGDVAAATALLAKLEAEGPLRIKPAEGYAFYALYPETYAEAARRSGLPPDTRVIGIRSIGTSLAPVVAAALGAAPPATVRPVGHPFDRQLSLSPRLAEHLLAGTPAAYAIVDEGPGLSGSSFASVAEWLAAHGVPRHRIHRFPSHPGEPGAMAGPERLAHWRASPSHHVPFEHMLPRLSGWVEELVGPLLTPLRDISGDRWRELVSPRTALSPVAANWGRRKFFAETRNGRFLVKFAGLGDDGASKLQVAQRLHAAGLVPEPAGLVHGLLVSRWIDAPGLPDAPIPRAELVAQLGGYLAQRAAIPASSGGSLTALRDMALYNTAEALGADAAASLDLKLAAPETLEPLVRRVATDNRLHAWEWLVAGGRLIKTDAVDHAHSHDLVGPQDIAWDIAGAIVEHDLSDSEARTLEATLAQQSGRRPAPEVLAFLLPCYLAFQLGSWSMTLGADATITLRYAGRLAALLRT